MPRVKLTRAEFVLGQGKIPEGGVILVDDDTARRFEEIGLAGKAGGNAKLHKEELRDNASALRSAEAAQLLRDSEVSAAWDAELRNLAVREQRVAEMEERMREMTERMERNVALLTNTGTVNEPGMVNQPVDPLTGEIEEALVIPPQPVRPERADRPSRARE